MKRRLKKEIDLATGVVVRETYLLGHMRHRDPDDGPADVWRDAMTGVVVREHYKQLGKLHRNFGPAEIERDGTTGVVTIETYWRHGMMHREPEAGPAWRTRDGANRFDLVEGYYVFDEPYRDPKEGPYYIERHQETGEITKQWFSEQDAPRPTEPRGRNRSADPGP